MNLSLPRFCLVLAIGIGALYLLHEYGGFESIPPFVDWTVFILSAISGIGVELHSLRHKTEVRDIAVQPADQSPSPPKRP